MKRTEVLICGFGGQGVIFAGRLLGIAAANAGLEAAQSASYGSEARGSACHSGVVVSSAQIGYPKVRRPDLLIAMSQEAYEKFAHQVIRNGKVVYDQDLVKPVHLEDVEQTGVPATDIATQLGRRAVANVVILSAAVKLTGFVSTGVLRRSIIEKSPKEFESINISAFERGVGLINA